MTATSDERREVARKIRKYVDAYGGGIEDAEIGIGGVEMVLLGTVRGRDNRGDVVRPTSEAGLLSILADLIDPTCHVVGNITDDWPDGSSTYIHELSCGHDCETMWPSAPAHCPHCGARVVDDDNDGD